LVDEKGVVKLRQIRVGGLVAEGVIEVLSGLKVGEKVAVDPVKAGMLPKKQKQ